MRDERQVKFNVSIATYREGQVVNYTDMPPGHQFWVDNKDILGSDRICEFVEEKKASVAEPESIPVSVIKVEPAPEPVPKPIIKIEPEPEPESESNPEPEDNISETDNDKPVESEIEKKKSLDFDFDNFFNKAQNEEIATTQKVCPGIEKKDGSPCTRTDLKENGYCWRHRFQAPVKSE